MKFVFKITYFSFIIVLYSDLQKNKLVALTVKGIGDAIQEYIEKDEKDAISELINFQVDKLQVKFIQK